MGPLTGLDGAFLALESPTTHLHILGAIVLDPTGVPGGVGFRRIRSLVDERLPLVPPFRMRMVGVPFGLQHPTLVEDPAFDLDYHVRRAGLPAPGGRRELAEFMADLAARPLDRSRPLWEFHVAEGLADGRTALVAKVHHAVIDGVSGADVLAAFFDLAADPGPVRCSGRSRRTLRRAGPPGLRGRKPTGRRLPTRPGRFRASWSSSAGHSAGSRPARHPGPVRDPHGPDGPGPQLPQPGVGCRVAPVALRGAPRPRSTGPSRPTGGSPSPTFAHRRKRVPPSSAPRPTTWSWP